MKENPLKNAPNDVSGPKWRGISWLNMESEALLRSYDMEEVKGFPNTAVAIATIADSI